MSLNITIDYGDTKHWGVPEHKKKFLTPEYVLASISDLLSQCGVTEGSFTVTLGSYDKMAVTRSLTVDMLSRKGTGDIHFTYRPLDKRDMPVLSCHLSGLGAKEGSALRKTMYALSKRLNKEMGDRWVRREPERKLQSLKQSLENRLRRKQEAKSALEEKVKSIRKQLKKTEKELASIRKQLTGIENSKGALS